MLLAEHSAKVWHRFIEPFLGSVPLNFYFRQCLNNLTVNVPLALLVTAGAARNVSPLIFADSKRLICFPEARLHYFA